MNNQMAKKQQPPELVVKQSIVYNTRQGATFGPQDVVEIYIPPSFALLDTKNTYLGLRLKMKGNLKRAPSNLAGAHALFRDMTIYDGSGQHVLEQIDQYAYLQAIREFYSENESLKNLRILHEGKTSSSVIREQYVNQYVNPSDNTGTSTFNQVECLVPLYLSGILSPDRESVWPNLASNGIRLRIVLHDAVQATQLCTMPIYNSNGEEVEVDSTTTNGNHITAGGGGYSNTYPFEVQANAALGATQLTLKRIGDLPNSQYGCLSADRGNPGHIFMPGQTITVNNATDMEVTEVSIDGNNRIVLTVPALTGAVAADETVFVKIDSSTTANESFEINDLKMYVSYVIPPPGYVEQILKQVGGKGLQIDVKTYTDYAVNISANSKNNSMYINSRENRAKAILSVPHSANGPAFIEDSCQPDRLTPNSYQYILYKVLTPNTRAMLNRFNLESYNAIALREQQHSLVAAGIPLNTIKDNYKCFFWGRKLANKGYSYNMNRPDEGTCRINIQYDENAQPLLVHNYICAIRRIVFRANGIDIIY